MKLERIFWEKATAIHIFCRRGKMRSQRAKDIYSQGLSVMTPVGWKSLMLRVTTVSP